MVVWLVDQGAMYTVGKIRLKPADLWLDIFQLTRWQGVMGEYSLCPKQGNELLPQVISKSNTSWLYIII